METNGLNVLVTGASRGLGAALAGALACEGARVVLVARSEKELGEVAERVRVGGGEAYPLAADVTEPGAAARIAGAAAALVGPIELLVNDAGSLGPVPLESLLATEDAAFEEALAVNLLGPFRLTKAVLGSMLLRGRGVVVNVSSDAATEAYPSWGAYGASKAAFEQMTRIWATEIEEPNVRFVVVDPGEMDTLMHEAAMPGADRAALADPAERARQIVELLRRIETIPSGSRVTLGRAA
ncbi:MAG TPA: SDR family oxidoreductase [Thermoanaerobaculia bacterium]|nr:SDR family oxidoreductase [Thermoanaerobaculia bacterium]